MHKVHNSSSINSPVLIANLLQIVPYCNRLETLVDNLIADIKINLISNQFLNIPFLLHNSCRQIRK